MLPDSESPISPKQPLPVVDVTNATRSESYSTSVTFITGAAGFTGVVGLPAPILSPTGDKVGSHWRKNIVWGGKNKVETVTVTETATSAAFTVYDPTYNLEQLFEGVANVGRFVARITIDGGSELYGWIGGVSVASNVYTFTVFTSPALTTQSWVGSLPTGRNVRKLEIFRDESSAVWTTGTVLTREIPWDYSVTEEQGVMNLLATMANGDYAFDFARGKLYYKKATTGTSDTLTYNTYGGSGGPTPDVNISQVGGDTVAAANTARTTASKVLPTQNIDAGGRVLNTPAVDSVAGATDTGVTDLIIRDDALTTVTPIDGDYMPKRGDLTGALWVQLAGQLWGEDSTNNVMQVVEKPLAVSTYTFSVDKSSALEASSIAKASPGNLYRCFGVVDATAPNDIYYIQFLDSATLTADGAITHLRSPEVVNHTTGTDSTFDTGIIIGGDPAANGITVCISTTMVLKAISGPYLFFTIKYK